MNKIVKFFTLLTLCCPIVACGDYLDTSTPENADDGFVTSTASETFKILSWCYANYRQNCVMGVYRWNDPIGSDAEYYPEVASLNNANARLQPELLSIGTANSAFNGYYTIVARLNKLLEIIGTKEEYIQAKEAGEVNEWTQLYGEALSMKAFCYFELVKHYGDVPYGYENTTASEYSLNSRFEILDKVIEMFGEAAPLMYRLGEGGITAERMSRGFAEAMAGMAALYSGGWQTVRTDVQGLYGDVQLETKGVDEYSSIYARRTDYLDYYRTAETYFDQAMADKGTATLVTTDERGYANNPFQRHFQYQHDLQLSPESIFEIGNMQGGQSGQTTSSEYPYAFGRASNGASQMGAPCKVFGAVRIMPTFYYGEFEDGDMRRDITAAVTGSNGDGNEAILRFAPGNKLDGGMTTNKWDPNRMNPPYVADQRQSGMNWPIMRLADLMLMRAEVKAVLGNDVAARSDLNDVRRRAFGDTNHDIQSSGDQLLADILQERKLEFAGEGQRRWDLIRNGLFVEKAVEVRAEMSQMVADLQSKGYHEFANGNQIPMYIWVKSVHRANPLTYDADPTDPALYPGWRGQYDYSTTDAASAVKGTDHNLAIEGLFEYIDPESERAKQLEADGYVKTDWGKGIVDNADHYCNSNLLPGVKAGNVPPRYYFPIPFEVLSHSNGKVTNGYGLAQE